MGPRSRFGVLGLRKSLPACDASRFDVLMFFPSCYIVDGSLRLTGGPQRLYKACCTTNALDSGCV